MVKSLIFNTKQYSLHLIKWGVGRILIIGLTLYSLFSPEKYQQVPENIKISLTVILFICFSEIVYVLFLYAKSRVKNKPEIRLTKLRSAYLSILDNLELGVIVLETNGNPIFINKYLISRLRYSRNELIEIGPDFTDRIIAPASKVAFLQYFNEATQSMWKSTKEKMKIEFISKENEHMWYEMSLMPVKSEEGIVLCLINFNEIMEEIQGEIKPKHRKSETLLKDILKYVSAWIYVKDTKGNFLLASDSMINYLGYDPEGMNDFEMVPFDTAVLFTELDKKVVATQKPIEFEYDFPLPMANNDNSKPFRALCKRFPMVDSKGEVYGIGVINIDITDQLRQREALTIATQQAEDTSSLQEQFLFTVSQELRTPLNRILGMNKILMETGMTDKQLELAVSIHSSAETMKSIVDDLLTFERVGNSPSGKETAIMEEPIRDAQPRSIIENPPYSISRLQELGNLGFVKEMMLVYLNSVPRLLLDMETALHEKRFADVQKFAHSAMSPVGFFQADQLFEILHQIEINADREGWESICEILIENARKVNAGIVAHMRNNLT